MRVNSKVRDEHRRALLASAATAFAGEGYDGAAIDRISESAGLAKGTIYNYFPSKRAIFEAVLLEACRYASDSADAVPDTAGCQERLEAFVAGNLSWAMANPALAVVLARELTAGTVQTRQLILGASEPCVEKVRSILEFGAVRGELALPSDMREMAIAFIALANALMLQASMGGWPSIGELPTSVASLFLRGVSNHHDHNEE